MSGSPKSSTNRALTRLSNNCNSFLYATITLETLSKLFAISICSFNDGYGNKVEILNDDGRRVVYGHLREILVKPGDKVTTTDIIGKTGSSGGSRVPHLHLEIRKSNTEETGLAYTIDPLELLPDIDLNSLTEEFTLEPYASLWRKLTSDKPWEFSKEDIPYADDKNYIR